MGLLEEPASVFVNWDVIYKAMLNDPAAAGLYRSAKSGKLGRAVTTDLCINKAATRLVSEGKSSEAANMVSVLLGGTDNTKVRLSSKISAEQIEPGDLEDAKELFINYPEAVKLDLVDWATVAYMKRKHIQTIVTYDFAFTELSQLNDSAIPIIGVHEIPVSKTESVNSDREIRALILSDMLRRSREGQRILTDPRQYAELLSVSDEVASLNLQYLLDKGLVQGEAISVGGTTDKFVNVHGITSRGIDALDGRGTGQFEINFRTINVNAPVTGQMAVGDNVVQNQLGSVSNFQELYRFVQGSLSQQQSSQLMPLLKELEDQANRDLVKPSTIKRVADLVSTYGPSAALIMDTIGRLLGLGH